MAERGSGSLLLIDLANPKPTHTHVRVDAVSHDWRPVRGLILTAVRAEHSGNNRQIYRKKGKKTDRMWLHEMSIQPVAHLWHLLH